MTKTICDICGNDMPLDISNRPIKEYNFCITNYGKAWDICNECRNELDKWMKKRKAESEENNKKSIPYLMHKEMDISLLECQKAYDVAMEYLRSQAKVKG